MPTYCFECQRCKQEWEEVFRMKDEKKSKCPKCKKIGNRIFTSPQANIDTKVDPWDINKAVEKTGKSKDTLGALWDRAKEMSEKRGGEEADPLYKKATDKYAKQRKGKQYRQPRKKGGSDGLSISFKA